MRYSSLFFLFVIALSQACQQARQARDHALSDELKQKPPMDSLGQKQLFDSLMAKAEKFQSQNQVDSAIFYFELAQPLAEKYLEDSDRKVDYYSSMGKLDFVKNKYFAADRHFEKARAIAEKSNASPEQLISIYQGLVGSKTQTKDLATALSYAQYVVKLIKENKPNDAPLMINSQIQFSAIHFYNKDYPKAIETLNDIISMNIRAGRESEIGTQYFNMAQVYSFYGKGDLALLNIDKAIAIDLKKYGELSKSVSNEYLVKAACFEKFDHNDSAEFYFRKTFEIRRKIFGEKDLNVFGGAYMLAGLFTKMERLDSASKYHQRGLISLLADFNSNDWHINPVPRDAECTNDLFIALQAKGEMLKKMADRDTARTEILDLSLRTLLLADSVMGVYRKNSIYDDSQQTLRDQYQISYEMMADIAYTLYLKTGQLKYLNDALRVMESSRATLLQGALQRARAFSLTGLPSYLKQKEKELVRRRAGLLASLETWNSQEKIDSINIQLLKVNVEEYRLLSEIKEVDPNYLAIKNEEHFSSLDLLKSQVKPKDAVYLEYLWGKRSIYALVVSGEDVQFVRIERDEKFNKAFNLFLSEIDSNRESYISKIQFQEFCNSAFYLYRQLVGGFMDGAPPRRVIISADGPLASFPFDALITQLPSSEEVDYRLPYFVNRYSLNYIYSSGLLALEREFHDRDDKLLAFGFGGESLSPSERDDREGLPGSTEEIDAIREIMSNHSNRFYLEQEATEYQFKKQIGGFNIVHLAIHGVADTINTLQSRLVFRSPGDPQEDGQLFAHELYDLDLGKLDLAVLSACESGIGKNRVGEGMMSMARGFAYAGCPSMVISLWKIDDRMAARVMGRFYNYLSEGEDIDRALAHAKTDFLAQASEFNSHPRYWAAFMQVGEIQPIRGSVSWMIIPRLILIALIFFLFFYLRKKIKF